MGHDPERAASSYLAGDMSAEQRSAFSEHLLACDACWSEVSLAQQGRGALEAARTVAPADLRDRVRALADTQGPGPQADRTQDHGSGGPGTPARGGGRRRAPVLVAVALLGAVLGGAAVQTGLGRSAAGPAADPAALRAAVVDFSARELPGRQLPDGGAPDLSALALRPVGAGGGSYAGLDVDGYAYRDEAGRRIVLYLSAEPFPRAADARPLAPADRGPDGPWVIDRDGVVVLCARAPHALLVVGEDEALVRRTALTLGVV